MTRSHIAATFALAIIVFGAVALAVQHPALAQPEPPTGNEDAALLKKLLLQRREVARSELARLKLRAERGLAAPDTADESVQVSLRLLEAELDLAEDRKARVDVLASHLNRMKELEETQKSRFRAGRETVDAATRAEYYRLDAEIRLLREKSKR